MFFIGWYFDLHDNIYRSRAVFWTVPLEHVSQKIEVSPNCGYFSYEENWEETQCFIDESRKTSLLEGLIIDQISHGKTYTRPNLSLDRRVDSRPPN